MKAFIAVYQSTVQTNQSHFVVLWWGSGSCDACLTDTKTWAGGEGHLPLGPKEEVTIGVINLVSCPLDLSG